MQEIWKDVNGYEGLYQVSNLGRVRSLERKILMRNNRPRTVKEKILVLGKTNHGYRNVDLCNSKTKSKFLVHRLVAKTFIPNIDDKPEVNHIDGNKSNNSVSNLEWCTSSENIIHAHKNNLIVSPFLGKYGGDSYVSKPVLMIDRVTFKEISKFDSAATAFRKTNIASQHISSCCKGKRKSAGGFIWKYAEENK